MACSMDSRREGARRRGCDAKALARANEQREDRARDRCRRRSAWRERHEFRLMVEWGGMSPIAAMSPGRATRPSCLAGRADRHARRREVADIVAVPGDPIRTSSQWSSRFVRDEERRRLQRSCAYQIIPTDAQAQDIKTAWLPKVFHPVSVFCNMILVPVAKPHPGIGPLPVIVVMRTTACVRSRLNPTLEK